MASALGSELTCSICLELFHDPVTLPCMHSYCRKCLESILRSRGGSSIQCPECRDVAFFNKNELRKLPRNFTLANIVAKYRSVDNIPQIPCDLCDVKMQQNAVKSCRECKMSYCMHCLIHHPQRGVLSKHSLIEPQDFVSQKMISVCLKCALLPEKGGKLENCRRDHGNEVMDLDAAKIKLKSKLQGDFVILDERRRKYLQEICKTTDTLDTIMKNADAQKTELKQKYNDVISDFEKDLKQIYDNYDSGVKEVENKGQGHLLQLTEASDHLHDILPDLKVMLEKNEKDLDFKDLQGLFTRVQSRVSEKVLPECKLVLPHLDIDKKVSEIFTEEGRSRASGGAKSLGKDAVEHKKIIPQVKIQHCTRNPRKTGEGASVTVTWDTQNLHVCGEIKFKVKFVEIADKDPGKDPFNVLTVRNINGSSLTVNQLQNNVTYSITVTVQDKPESESESTIVHTLSGVHCVPFSLSSLQRSKDTWLNWTNKHLRLDPDEPDERALLNRALGVAAGTTALFNQSTYWEVEISYHLHGIEDSTCVLFVGICAMGKLDVIPRFISNYFFYGVSVGRDSKGKAVLWTEVEGRENDKYHLKGEKHVRRKLGFFYSTREPNFVVVSLKTNSVILTIKHLKSIRGEKCMYQPVFGIGTDVGDPSIEVISGPDVTEIPTCLQEYLE